MRKLPDSLFTAHRFYRGDKYSACREYEAQERLIKRTNWFVVRWCARIRESRPRRMRRTEARAKDTRCRDPATMELCREKFDYLTVSTENRDALKAKYVARMIFLVVWLNVIERS